MASNLVEEFPKGPDKSNHSESWGTKATPLSVQKIQPWRAWVEPENIRTFSATCGPLHPDIRLQQQRDEHGGAGG